MGRRRRAANHVIEYSPPLARVALEAMPNELLIRVVRLAIRRFSKSGHALYDSAIPRPALLNRALGCSPFLRGDCDSQGTWLIFFGY